MSRGARRADEGKVIRASMAVVAALAITGVGLLVSDLKPFADDRADSAAPRATPTSTASAGASTASASPSASTSPSASPTVRRMTAPRMTAFLRRYLATAPRDQRAAWRLLTPGFQRVSNGFGAYARFWGPVDTARPSGIFADPPTRRITYRVRYTYSDGHTFVDNTRLRLRLTDSGALRIAGEG